MWGRFETDRLPSVWITPSLALLLVVLFVISIRVADAAGFSGPKPYFESKMGTEQLLTTFLVPFFHSGWKHLLENTGMLLVFGSIIEYRETSELYAVWLAAVVVFSNLFVPQLGMLFFPSISSSIGIGTSGITFALVGREVTYRSGELRNFENPYRTICIWAIAVFVLFMNVSSILSLTAAWVSHATGQLIGLGTGIIERTKFWS